MVDSSPDCPWLREGFISGGRRHSCSDTRRHERWIRTSLLNGRPIQITGINDNSMTLDLWMTVSALLYAPELEKWRCRSHARREWKIDDEVVQPAICPGKTWTSSPLCWCWRDSLALIKFLINIPDDETKLWKLLLPARFLSDWEEIVEIRHSNRWRRQSIQRITAGMATEIPTLNLVAISTS